MNLGLALALASGSGRPSADPAYARDRFTDAAGTLLTVHTMDIGNGWNNVAGSWKINPSGTLIQETGSLDQVIVTETNQADGILQIELNVGAPAYSYTAAGLIFRYTDTNNYWAALVYNDVTIHNELRLFKKVAGSFTMVSSSYYQPYDNNASYTLQVTMSGNVISVGFHNLNTPVSATDSFNHTATKMGIHSQIPSGQSYQHFRMLPLV